MNKIFALLVIVVLVSFYGCKKEATETWKIKYQLLNIGQETPVYRVNYILPNGSSKQVGPVNTYNWESEELEGFESGKSIYLEIELISGDGQYQFIILRNGAVHEKAIMPVNAPAFVLETEI